MQPPHGSRSGICTARALQVHQRLQLWLRQIEERRVTPAELRGSTAAEPAASLILDEEDELPPPRSLEPEPSCQSHGGLIDPPPNHVGGGIFKTVSDAGRNDRNSPG